MIVSGCAAFCILSLFLSLCEVIVRTFPKVMDADWRHEVPERLHLPLYQSRAETYWYPIIFLIRHFLIVMTPIVPDALPQLALMQLIVLPAFALIAYVMPWRVFSTNAIVACGSSAASCMVSFGSLFSPDPNLGVVSLLCCAVVVGTAGAIIFGMLWGVVDCCRQRRKPFRFFICQQKASAGALARLLKLLIGESSKSNVFIDSDDLTNLEELPDYVACSSPVTLGAFGARRT